MEENKCVRFLKMASLGKYYTKLYYGDKKGEYSTVTGGVITLSVALVLIATSINILIQTFRRDSYTVSTQYTELLNTDLIDTLTLRQFKQTLLDFRYVIPQYSESKINCSLKEIIIYTVPGVFLSNIDLPEESIKASFNFSEVLEIETGISKLGVTKFCIFNQPDDIRHNISNAEYRQYVDSISPYKAFNITSNIVQKDTMGVSIFKTIILM